MHVCAPALIFMVTNVSLAASLLTCLAGSRSYFQIHFWSIAFPSFILFTSLNGWKYYIVDLMFNDLN